MNLPFTQAEFMQLFARYNQAIWPTHVLFYVLGLAVSWLTIARKSRAAQLSLALLALFWFWMGALYHIIYFRSINPAAIFFGTAFIVQGLLLAIAALRVTASAPAASAARRAAGIALLFYALVGYPLVGLVAGHTYPSAPIFGAAPCPTTIFTFGMFLLTGRRVPRYLVIIPLLWAAVGTMAAVGMGMIEDYGLAVSAVITAVLLLLPAGGRTSSHGVASRALG